MTELEVMSKLIIGGKILNICDADDTVLTVDIEKKIQELLQTVIKKSKKKKKSVVRRKNIWVLASGRAQHANYELEMLESTKYRILNI